jgi:hypothetical protein
MRFFLLPAIVLLFSCAESSRADKPAPPHTYKELSADKKFVFVMIAPGSVEDELKGYNENYQKVVKDIRDVYSKTGLYKNDGSKDPIWTIDWYRHSVSVASDGVHLVRFGRWPVLEGHFKDKDFTITKNDMKQEAFSIFSKGKLVRSFSIGELVDDPKRLSISVSHFMWLEESRINDGKGLFDVTTLDRNRFLIELATGKIVEKKKLQ